MPADVLLVTRSIESINKAISYCADDCRKLIIVNMMESDELVIKKTRGHFNAHFYNIDPERSISWSVNRALTSSHESWVFLLTDETVSLLSTVGSLEDIAVTIPRLASLKGMALPGISPSRYHSFFGTLYSRRVLRDVKQFDPSIRDLSVVAYNWAREVQNQGWFHMLTYVESSTILPPSVLPRSVETEESNGDGDQDAYIVPNIRGSGQTRWRGLGTKPPWAYSTTVVIPHYGPNVRILMSAVESWRHQFNRPYILVYDTGTPSKYHPDIRAISSEDVEVHFMRWHGLREPLTSVSLAFDHGIIDCRTRRIIFTHNDVFPLSQTIVDELVNLCDESNPVVGYESHYLSERVPDKLVGTQLTCAYLPTLNRVRLRWISGDRDDSPEEGFGLSLHYAGIKPRFIGIEKNSINVRTTHFHHVGKFTTAPLYYPGIVHHVNIAASEVIEEAEKRLMRWRESSDG
jgi:hypothetical protein